MKQLSKGLIIISIFATALTACSSNNPASKLAGTWYSENGYSFSDGQGGYACLEFIFSGESTYYDSDMKKEKFVFSDSHIKFLSGGNEGLNLQVMSLSKDKLKVIGSYMPDSEGVETFKKLPEIKDFESFMDGVWILKEENIDIESVIEFDNGLVYYDDDTYPIHFINGNIILISLDDYNEILFVKKINKNKIIIYDGCLSIFAEEILERYD